MPQPLIRRVDETDEELAERYIEQLDDAFLYCRARRRHRYPVILPPKKGKTIRLPRGFSFEPAPDMPGYLLVTEVCEICGRVCHSITDRSAFLTGQIKRTYKDPPGYPAPKGTGAALAGGMALRELERRMDEGGLFGVDSDA